MQVKAKADLPTGATIVCTFGGVLILMFMVSALLRRGKGAPPNNNAQAARAA